MNALIRGSGRFSHDQDPGLGRIRKGAGYEGILYHDRARAGRVLRELQELSARLEKMTQLFIQGSGAGRKKADS